VDDQYVSCKKIDITHYRSVKEYLLSFGKERLEQSGNEGGRKKTGNSWFETQDQISYWQLFDEPKIIWGELSDDAKFTFDEAGHYLNNTIFMLTGQSLKLLLGVLNSKVAQWYFGTTSGMGTNRWLKYKIEQLPVPVPTEQQKNQIKTLVNQVLFDKKEGKDTGALEAEIDRLVYAFYELTPAEIAMVEGDK